MDSSFSHCWLCQVDLRYRDVVQVAEGVELPCCRDCWVTIDAGARLRAAQAFYDRPVMGATLETLRDVLREVLADYREHREDAYDYNALLGDYDPDTLCDDDWDDA